MADTHIEPLYPYPTNIYIQDKAQASAFAHSILTEGHQERTLFIWADGSACGGHGCHPCAGAITFVSPRDGLRKEIVTVSHHHCSGDAEILAIWETFRQAAQIAELFDRLMVFSNAQSALLSVQAAPRESLQKSRCAALINDIMKHANAFYNEGIEVEMH
ncbi:hypothetical protein CC86DRAFT_406323 [Ophiobolus disseminans]|uniref:RNase H type-1 domain-containing protein n=1 Tax=Ophiobolus disseminans TaxID=1469910 RepID=A0A6A7A2R2_9PLEO|nr:hypothetical protein CC86DRAFT_406323 [Ophiobolus disseminans]